MCMHEQQMHMCWAMHYLMSNVYAHVTKQNLQTSLTSVAVSDLLSAACWLPLQNSVLPPFFWGPYKRYKYSIFKIKHPHTYADVLLCREKETLSGAPACKHVLKHKGTICMLNSQLATECHTVQFCTVYMLRTLVSYTVHRQCMIVWVCTAYTYQMKGLSRLMSLQYCTH